MNEKFHSLPEEKQTRIINAAMEVFSQNEYKNASTDDICAKAGISKGSLFYYFRNKKQLYLYLYEYTVNMMSELIVDDHFREITDFFELLSYAAAGKSKILCKTPYILDFSVRCFYSKGEAVSPELNHINDSYMHSVWEDYFQTIDFSKFRDGADPIKLYQMLVWMADGYLHQKQIMGIPFNLDELMEEFTQWMKMMRKLFYKEEYLNEHD